VDLELTEDQQVLADSVRQFLETECPMSLVRRVVEEGKDADELWAAMTALDWPAMGWAEAYGGLGLGQVELAVVNEALGRVLAPVPFLASSTQFAAAVIEAGTDEQRRRFSTPLLSGVVGTLAVAEGGGRWAVEDTATVATPSGGGWILRGEKHAVLDATKAEEIAVSARLPGSAAADGIGLFVVPQGDAEVVPMESIDLTRPLCRVRLEDVEVDASRALGEPGAMGPALGRVVERATVALCAEMVGTSQAIFDIVLAYVKEREQFGVKIGSFQAIKHKLANMYVALEAARATTYFAAVAIDEDDERRQAAVWMAKSSAGDCQKLLAQEGIQCLGGIGYTWEHDMHLYVKRQKAQAALFGTGAEHRQRLAGHLGLS
jgi:alkylation response protein AidB-like acyl-CoA dehydrogenase